VWKFAQGGIFHPDQMSGVLLYQHKELLTNSPGYWQTNLLVFNQAYKISYFLYAAACLFELSFLIGFFTKKYDRYLVAFFLGFLIIDYFIMRIAYFDWLPFVIVRFSQS
jgi:hypothetical protein